MSNIAPAWSDVTAVYPMFIGKTYQTSGPLQLAVSTRLLAQGPWGDFWSDAIMLDCAHNLLLNTLAQQANGMGAVQLAAGPISSTSVAGTSTSFNTATSNNKSNVRDWYLKTTFGQQFLRLQDVVIPIGFTSGGGFSQEAADVSPDLGGEMIL